MRKRVERNKAHRILERKMGYDIKGDVDHIKPLSKGGKTRISNLRIRRRKANRSFKRKADGSMK